MRHFKQEGISPLSFLLRLPDITCGLITTQKIVLDFLFIEAPFFTNDFLHQFYLGFPEYMCWELIDNFSFKVKSYFLNLAHRLLDPAKDSYRQKSFASE